MTSVADFIRRAGEQRADEVAVIGQGRHATFGQLDERSNRVARALVDAGVTSGDRVAYAGLNRTEVFEIAFGAVKAGAVPVPLNFRVAAPELAALLADCDAAVLICEPAQAHGLRDGGHALPGLRLVVVVAGPEEDTPHDAVLYEDWLAAHAAVDPGARPGPNELACLLYSSGTTGHPKGVMITNANLLVSMRQVQDRRPLYAGDRSMCIAPYFHVLGYAWAMHVLKEAAVVVQVRDAAPGALLELIAGDRVKVAVLVPVLIDALLREPRMRDADLSSLRLLLYGSAPISARVLAEAVAAFGCEFEQSYGLTECSGGATILSPDDHREAAHRPELLRSAGRPAEGTEIKLVDPGGLREVGPGENGEVLVRSAQVMAGYWRRPDETAAVLIPEGWLRTGDIGRLDEQGYLTLVDRAKDMIVSGGENIYPAEVEAVLVGHPSVAEVAVVGIPSARWGESPLAVLVGRPGADIDGAEVIAWCRERLAHYKCPVRVDVVDALPRNASGKVLRRVLREPYWLEHERRVG